MRSVEADDAGPQRLTVVSIRRRCRRSTTDQRGCEHQTINESVQHFDSLAAAARCAGSGIVWCRDCLSRLVQNCLQPSAVVRGAPVEKAAVDPKQEGHAAAPKHGDPADVFEMVASQAL